MLATSQPPAAPHLNGLDAMDIDMVDLFQQSLLQRVPVELYREIVAQLHPAGDRLALRTLCLVNQTLRDEAERQLYGRVDVAKPCEVALLCDLLTAIPRIAALVGELTIVTNDVPRSDQDFDEVPLAGPPDFLGCGGDVKAAYASVDWTSNEGARRYWRSVSRALRALPNLHTLTLAADRNLRFAWVLRGCTFKLRRFCGYMAWDGALAQFLADQHAITDLELLADSSYVPGTTEFPLLPGVKVLRACILDLDMAATLIQRRPVTHLMITTASLHDSEVQEIARELGGPGGSSGPVLGLTIDFGDASTSGETLALLADSFPALRFLGTVPFYPDPDEAAIFLGSLRRFTELKTLVLNVPDDVMPPYMRRQLALDLRAVCPTLQCVAFAQGAPPVNECFTWHKGAAHATEAAVVVRDNEEMWLAAGQEEEAEL